MSEKCIECNKPLSKTIVDEDRIIHPNCHKKIMDAIFSEQKNWGLTKQSN